MAKMDFGDIKQVRVAPIETVKQAALSRLQVDPYVTIEDCDRVAHFVEIVSLAKYLKREQSIPAGEYYSIWLVSSRGRSYGLGYWEGESKILDLHTFNYYQASPAVADFVRSALGNGYPDMDSY